MLQRSYRPVQGGRRYNSTKPEVFEKAVADLQDGKSQRKVCEDYGIPRLSLQNFLKVSSGDRLPRVPGGQTVLRPDEEKKHCSTFSYAVRLGVPFWYHWPKKDSEMVRLSDVSRITFQVKTGVTISWRDTKTKSKSVCQNISRKRTEISSERVQTYFDNLKISLEEIPLANIINYDETNLTDDPGRKKLIFKRGVRYPERILNSTESSTSLLLAGTATGQTLLLYVVYKA